MQGWAAAGHKSACHDHRLVWGQAGQQEVGGVDEALSTPQTSKMKNQLHMKAAEALLGPTGPAGQRPALHMTSMHITEKTTWNEVDASPLCCCIHPMDVAGGEGWSRRGQHGNCRDAQRAFASLVCQIAQPNRLFPLDTSAPTA